MSKQSGIFIKNLLILLVIPFILLFIIKYVNYHSINSNKNNFIQLEQFKDMNLNTNVEEFQLPHNISIKFHSIPSSQKLYKNLDLIKYFQANEIKAKTNYRVQPTQPRETKYLQNEIQSYYLENVSDFTKTEQNSIFKIIMQVSEKIRKMISFKSLEWKFAKLSLNTDWNYPYTIDDTIVLPTKFIRNITYFYKTNNPPVLEAAENTFIHEWLHIVQRNNQELFNQYYKKYWNYVFCPDLKHNMLKNKWIKRYWITNPDGVNGDWAIETSKGLITPMVLLDNDLHTHRKILIKLSPSKDNIMIDRNSREEKPIFYTYEQVPDFKEKVFHISQSYHPNEVFANLVAEQIMKQKNSTEIEFLNKLLS